VRLGPHHKSGLAAALVLEFESDQWVLYLLDASGKIIEPIFPGTLDNAISMALQTYGVAPGEWKEDSDNQFPD
jgi:hypothetical protein